jgi:chemotaxis protein MotB
MKGSKPVIIKKPRKRGHEAGHGGSWKVAYADFVTAMMAFFLLLWLITMVAPEKRARVASYFKHFALFQQTGASVLAGSVEVVEEPGGEAPKVPEEMEKGSFELRLGKMEFDSTNKEQFMEKLKEDIEKKLADVKDQVMVDIFEGGVRIQLVDKEGKPMFALGSAEPTPDAKKILKVISENIKDLQNRVSIEGHTDSLTYSSNRYTNWELSTERASAVRKELEHLGMDPDRLTRVAGYAATDPLVKDNPADPRNRRVSILLFYPPEVSQGAQVPRPQNQ